jgi:hypothetical protein
MQKPLKPISGSVLQATRGSHSLQLPTPGLVDVKCLFAIDFLIPS